MGLQTYHAKRNFRRTPEPRGRAGARKSTGWSFVVQKHAARNLHYDFRLELDGVLLSWAIPKGPSLDPADKRLAVHVEDHPLEYGGFEGVIPEGEYGGGTVMVWDRGTWSPQGDPRAGYAKGHLKFVLDGVKLKGGWALVRTRGGPDRAESKHESWLLIKERDKYAKRNEPTVDAESDSVISRRSMDEIADARAHVWHSNLSVKENLRGGAIPAAPPSRAARAESRAPPAAGTKSKVMPARIAPMLATLVSRAPEGDAWISEIKYDGYRMVCRIARGRAQLLSRTGKDWTKTFPTVARDLAALPVKTAWIDGEVVVLEADGRTSFQALQNALTGASTQGLAFFAFDILYRDGYDFRNVALAERQRVLREIVGSETGTIRLGPAARGDAEEFLRQACALRLEGIVCKRADSVYTPGIRSRAWVKVKCMQRQEMVIGGYTDPQGSRKGFGALMLGYYTDGKLRYAGKVGTGFDDKLLLDLTPQLVKRARRDSPFVNPPKGFAAKGAHWIRPDLVAEVSFTEWSRDGALRHPSFEGLRRDKKAADVVREVPVAPRAAPPPNEEQPIARKAPRTNKVDMAEELAGVALSNPDKVYFPEGGVTKHELAAYYVSVAPWLLPQIKGRPLSLVRCPDGWKKQCFYQKHADPSVHPAVARMEVPESKGKATYFSAGSAAALAGLVQWGVIELHPWGSRAPRLDRPDRVIFDFDPDEKLAWKDLVTGVGLLRTLLEEMKLVSFLKTTGGKGLHVVLPIRPTLTWDDAKAFSRAVADFLERTFPDRFTATVAKNRRGGKIFIDYLRNAEGATAIAPYGVRARQNAPVSMPIDWSELAQDVRFDHFNVRNAIERLKGKRADPWAKFSVVRQTITAAMRKRLA